MRSTPPRRRALQALAAVAAASTGACASWPAPDAGPIELLHADGQGPTAAPDLLLMLPGAYSAPHEFVDEGFVHTLRERHANADVVIAGAGIAHLAEGKVVARLRDEVVAPARGRGVGSIWLVGISLGGLFALAYAARHPDDVSGVLALAPYLGRRDLVDEIAAAGGPAAWAAGRQPRGDDALEHEVWRWFARAPVAPPLYLGYGRDDRFVDAHRLLARQLPAGHAFDVAGGHDWPAWRALWQLWLARGLIGARPPTPGRA